MALKRASRFSMTETDSRTVAWPWLGCVVALGVVCGSPAAAIAEQSSQVDADVETLREAGVKPDAAGLRAYLKQFIPSASDAARVAQLIKDLGGEEFKVRQAATKALAALPVFPREALEKAALDDDPEVRNRAKGLLELGENQGQRTHEAALAVFARQKIKALAAEVLAAGAHCPKSDRSRIVTKALVATVTPADTGMLRKELRSDALWRRLAAATALDHLLAAKADKDLLALLKDPNDSVRLTAGRLLINRENRAGLVSLTELLVSKDPATRRQSAESLQWLIGKTFDYDPFAGPEKRNASAEKWLAWARGPGQKAKLQIPIKPPGVIQLFNGTNLSDWKAVNNGQNVDPSASWQIKGGVLRSKGTGRGYLYHKHPREDYELIVEWRWPDGPGDSGVWFMMAKPGGVKPMCLEAQLLAGSAGDFWLLGNLAIKAQGKRAGGHVAKMAATSERPVGQWNRMTIRVLKGTVEVKVNGARQNTATDCPRKPGHIALQTEGDVVEFRRVQIRPLGR